MHSMALTPGSIVIADSPLRDCSWKTGFMIKLTPITKMTANVESISTTRLMPLGVRQNYIVSGGTLEGELSGRVLPGGGDFLLVDPSGIGHVDARLTWELSDGTIVYVQYLGRVVMSDQVGDAFKSGRETALGDTYFITQLRFEVGDGPYKWLNSTVAIGEGRVAAGRAIQYVIYRCDHV